jgi:hypothetical protein
MKTGITKTMVKALRLVKGVGLFVSFPFPESLLYPPRSVSDTIVTEGDKSYA